MINAYLWTNIPFGNCASKEKSIKSIEYIGFGLGGGYNATWIYPKIDVLGRFAHDHGKLSTHFLDFGLCFGGK
jgi:hypothetical protein